MALHIRSHRVVVVGQVERHLPGQQLANQTLNLTRSRMGSQWSSCNTSEIWSLCRRVPVISRSVAFCTDGSLHSRLFGSPYRAADCNSLHLVLCIVMWPNNRSSWWLMLYKNVGNCDNEVYCWRYVGKVCSCTIYWTADNGHFSPRPCTTSQSAAVNN